MGVLTDWHREAQGEFQDYFGAEIVSTYGRLPMEYAAMFRSAAVMDMPHRGIVRVSGEDRYTFLNGLLTAELIGRGGERRILAGDVKGAFLLDRKGRVQGEMRVLDVGEQLLLEMDRRLVASVVKELEKYHFREKVSIAADEAAAVIGVFGPAAGRVIAGAMGIAATELADGKCAAAGQRVVWRDDLGDATAYGVVVSQDELSGMWERLVQGPDGAIAIGWAAYNAARIEAGRGMLGIDYDNTFLPAETGQLERMVSFTKGCYPGQEIVVRMQSREQCARRVASVKVVDSALPVAGEKVYASDGANEVGAITSSTISPRQSGAALCLAVLKKPAFEPGTQLRIAAEGAMRDAVVVETTT